MADAPDSKSGRGNPVRVQVPPPAPNKNINLANIPASATSPILGSFNLTLTYNGASLSLGSSQ